MAERRCIATGADRFWEVESRWDDCRKQKVKILNGSKDMTELVINGTGGRRRRSCLAGYIRGIEEGKCSTGTCS